MDDVELPPLPPSQTPPRKSLLSLLSRKRSRLDYEPEPGTSSDPALFSSDDPAPSAEHYSAKRRKDKWRGTWWGDRLRGETPREKRQFKRNHDSGIWMGSEGTESSLEDEFLHDQRNAIVHESFLKESMELQANADARSESSAAVQSNRVVGQDTDATPRVNPQVALENAYLLRARGLVQACVDAGVEDVDLSSTLGGDLPTEILQPLRLLTKHSAIREPPASQETFASLEADLRIYLANNALRSLPAILFDFNNLRVLSLRHNHLTEIPPAIGRLRNLESLNVANNKLRWLPYEVLELIRFGKLSYLLAEPNPWVAIQFSEICTGTNDIPLPRILPLQKGTIHRVQKVAESTPDYFCHDGTPTAVVQHADGALPPELSERSSSRSLMQVALLSCCNEQDLADLPEWLLDDLPPNVRKLLELARGVQASGGRLCTACRRKMVIPRKQWTEWWSMSSYHAIPTNASHSDKVYPFQRQQCSLACSESARSLQETLGS